MLRDPTNIKVISSLKKKDKRKRKVQVECFQPVPQQAVSSKAPLAGGEIKASVLASSPPLLGE